MSNDIDRVLDFLASWIQQKNLKLKGGAIKKGGHVQDVNKLYPEFLADLTTEIDDVIPPKSGEFKECLNHALKTVKDEAYDGVEFEIPTVKSVKEFVPQCLERLKITISPLGDEISNDYGRNIAIGDLENTLLCEAHIYNEESTVDGKQLRRLIAATAVKDFIKKVISDRAGVHWQTTLKAITYNADFALYPDVYLKGIIENFSFQGDPELNLAVLKQWLWQTKRFFMGKPVTDPIMLNLYAAKGGGGKTQIIKKLSEPLEAYTATSTLDAVLDSREHGLFTDRYIVFFDEMSLGKIEHGQIGPLMAGLKKLLTEDKITQRNMRENSHSKKRRTFSPAATSNQPLTQLLPDDSGMRRFFEIEMLATPNTARILQLRAIDASVIWKGIDENLERGYIVEGSRIHEKLKAHQAELKHRSVLDECLENMDDVPLYNGTDEVKELDAIKSVAEAEKRAEELGLVVYKPYEFSKVVKDWCEDEMDKFLAKFIPGSSKIINELRARDFYVYGADHRNFRIFVKDISTGGRL